MSHETAAPERKHLRSLERRIAHLEGRLTERKDKEGVLQGSATYEAAELAALHVALKVMRLYRDTANEDDAPTHTLLERAADRLFWYADRDDPLGEDRDNQDTELVEELRQRAVLLGELEQ